MYLFHVMEQDLILLTLQETKLYTLNPTLVHPPISFDWFFSFDWLFK